MIAMVDCNSFYVSCEFVFQPKLRGLPGIVLSNNDGCAIARNTPAKALGIEMGAPYFKIRDLCRENNVQVFSSNFSLYTDMSMRVMKTLKEFSPKIEYYSIDECWLDLTGFKHWDLEEYGKEIKETVQRNTGIPVSVGIAPTKVMAKVANHIAKKWSGYKGVCLMDNKEIQDILLSQFPVSDLWGVGRASATKFSHMGIKTAKQLRDFKNDSQIQKIFTKTGRQVQDELRGISCHAVTPEGERKKEIIQSRTFGTPIYTKDLFIRALSNYTHTAAERMRSQKSVCTQIQVFARTNPFKEVAQYHAFGKHKFNTGTACTLKLTQAVEQVANRIFKPGYEYRKAGVRLVGLKDSWEYQGSLFDTGDSDINQRLMSTMDYVNLTEGPMKLKSMSCGTSDKAWRMNQDFLTSRYTTSWNDLPGCS